VVEGGRYGHVAVDDPLLRGSEGVEKTPDKGKRIEYKGDTPFTHPYYWAAFTLIGDPD
jgi:CHAT domain-containing protein